MSFLYIDRITRLERGRSIVAQRNFTLAEDVFRDHFVGCPVVPASLLIESLHQAATALLEISSAHRKKAIPVMLDRAKFRALVQPGDPLRITVTMVSADTATAQLDGTIHVADRLVLSAALTFALREADEFYPPHARAWLESTYAFWLKHAEVVNGEGGTS